MKQKTRYNIRLALRKGVIVQPSADLDLFYRLLDATGQRDQFGIHSVVYYRRAYELFHPRGEGELLLAQFEGEVLAALMAFAHGERAWYFYGASAGQRRDLMPTYLIQWEAMRWARARGCTEYDLWGVPDVDQQVLESQFTARADGLWGVYRFKRGFGGQLHRAAGPWDRVYRDSFYKVYLWWLRKGSGERG
jgi:lipid II:glycine glycyltransferase (peptidoglycan interpeptide bridge formation enzyme)